MKFNDNIIIVADLGQLKAYKVSEAMRKDTAEVKEVGRKVSANLSLVTDIDYIAAHLKQSEQVSDKEGSFRGSNSEPHNRQIESTTRLLKNISEDIKNIIQSESPQAWCLAFPKETHKQLDSLLSDQIKSSLRKSLSSNLTKIPKEKLLSHFD